MNNSLVGYTGFVGSNLLSRGSFDGLYNSKNIDEAFGTQPDRLYFCGLGAKKYLANTNPQADLASVEEAFRNIERIAPRALTLISTVDVYRNPSQTDEGTPVDTEGLHPYGLHRYRLEQLVRDSFPDALIVRLPGLFGKNIKKNFIYDLIHPVPSALSDERFQSLDPTFLTAYYRRDEDGFWRLRPSGADEQLTLFFKKSGFSALSFTDSRARFQFYDLGRLWDDLALAQKSGLRLLNLATEPLGAGEIYERLFGKEFQNHLSRPVPRYDMRTLHCALFGGSGGYICSADEVFAQLAGFLRSEGVAIK